MHKEDQEQWKKECELRKIGDEIDSMQTQLRRDEAKTISDEIRANY